MRALSLIVAASALGVAPDALLRGERAATALPAADEAPRQVSAVYLYNAATLSFTSFSPGSLALVSAGTIFSLEPIAGLGWVTIGGSQAPVLSVNNWGHIMQIPTTLFAGNQQVVVYASDGQIIGTTTVTLTELAPTLWVVNPFGPQALGLAYTEQGGIIDENFPAARGSKIFVVATGLGPTNPVVSTGQIPANPAPTIYQPTATIDGAPATVLSSALANTQVGHYQVEIQIPASAENGLRTLRLTLGSVPSNDVLIPIGTVTVGNPPQLSLTPNCCAGSFQTFSLSASDTDGVNDIRWLQFMVAASPDGGGMPFCLVHYDIAGNGLWLYGDHGAFMGPVAPGTASAALQNSACALNTQSASYTSAVNALLRVPLTFKSGGAGAKFLYGRALDRGGLDTGFLQLGTWTAFAPPPTSPGLSPTSGSGSAASITATFPDPSGFTGFDLGWGQILFAVSPTGGGQPFCLIHYDIAGNSLWLYGDQGFFLGPVTPGSNSFLSNNACILNAAGHRIQRNVGQIEWRPAVAFRNALLGAKNVYLRHRNALGADTGFLSLGTWTVTNTPAAVAVHPPVGTGTTASVVAHYHHPAGAQWLNWGQLLMAAAQDGGGQAFCLAHYDARGNGFWLYSPAGFFVGPVTPGAATVLDHAWCRLTGASSQAQQSGERLLVNPFLTLKTTMPATVKTYIRTMDSAMQDTGWQERGSWTR